MFLQQIVHFSLKVLSFSFSYFNYYIDSEQSQKKILFKLQLGVTVEPAMSKKSGLSRQVAAHRRFICIQNVILGNDQVASHRRLAAH